MIYEWRDELLHADQAFGATVQLATRMLGLYRLAKGIKYYHTNYQKSGWRNLYGEDMPIRHGSAITKSTSNYNRRIGGYDGKELKFLDCAWNSRSMSSSTTGGGGLLDPSVGSTLCISCPAQGIGESQRLGRTYHIKEVFFSGVVNTTALAAEDDVGQLPGYFFALVLDTQANKSFLQSEDVYLNPTDNANAMLPTPLRNLQNTHRFRILDSKYIDGGGAYGATDEFGLTVAPQGVTTVEMSWKGDIKVECTGTIANVSSVSDNAIHLVCYAVGTSISPLLVAKSRVRFVG